MKMITNSKQIALTLITIVLVIFWTMVSLEKFWSLSTFHKSLIQQPFPDNWADVLFIVLPVLELAAAILIIWPKKEKFLSIGMWILTILMLGFTIFIGLGVAGYYATPSCGCAFVLKGLTWPEHLIFNIIFLILSLLGIWLSKPKYHQEDPDKRHNQDDPDRRSRKPIRLWWDPRVVSVGKLKKLLSFRMRFNCKKYALYWLNA